MSTRLTVLDNGMRVVTDAMETVETASLGVWVEAGTRHETPQVNGISHLLEHMAFKGTRRRDARAIAEEIEAVGGQMNAYTSRENTAYYAKVLKEDVGLALDVIADILQNSVMDPEELARERSVIVQEIRQANDTPDDIIFDHFQETAFPDQAIGRPVLGTEHLVETMPRESILAYMRDHYSPSRLVLSAAGRVNHVEIVNMAEAAFTDLTAGPSEAFDPLVYKGGDYRESRNLDQVQFVLGLEGAAYDSPDYYPMTILTTILGGGMSSRLFQEVREKRGLAYSIYAFASSYVDGGVFGIHAGTGAGELEELVPVIADALTETIYGWAIQEMVFKLRRGAKGNQSSKYDDGRIGWAAMAPRHQETIYRWDLDKQGRVRGVVQ
ncbi:MAG: M16 family metallopeptidase, partial [Magnetospiraceae bacterium]